MNNMPDTDFLYGVGDEEITGKKGQDMLEWGIP